MATYQELCVRYRKRKNDTLVDSITTGLAMADDVAVGLDVFDSVGTFETVLDSVCDIVPFAVIAATEGHKVIFGKKSASVATSDMAFRSVKSGAALAVGAGVATIAGGFVALPAAISTRFLFDRFKTKALLTVRMKSRVESMRFLRGKWKPELTAENDVAKEPALLALGQ